MSTPDGTLTRSSRLIVAKTRRSQPFDPIGEPAQRLVPAEHLE